MYRSGSRSGYGDRDRDRLGSIGKLNMGCTIVICEICQSADPTHSNPSQSKPGLVIQAYQSRLSITLTTLLHQVNYRMPFKASPAVLKPRLIIRPSEGSWILKGGFTYNSFRTHQLHLSIEELSSVYFLFSHHITSHHIKFKSSLVLNFRIKNYANRYLVHLGFCTIETVAPLVHTYSTSSPTNQHHSKTPQRGCEPPARHHSPTSCYPSQPGAASCSRSWPCGLAQRPPCERCRQDCRGCLLRRLG